jgi:4-hydroxy-tetrahydrodipicolinate synthase
VRPPSPDETLAFVEEVAAASPLPLVLYHHPGRGADPAFETIVAACQVPNVAAIKDSSREISRNLRAVEEIQKAGHAQYLATVQPMLAVMVAGGAGAMMPAGITLVGAAIRDAVRDGDLERAGRMQSLVARFPAAWSKYGLLPLAKAALEMLGTPVGAPARPYEPVPEAVLTQIKPVIDQWENELPTWTRGD